MAKVTPGIPESELEVLSALWRLKEGTVRQVRDDLKERGRALAHTTVLTLLGRLEGRGCVECRRGGAANIYRPLVSRNRIAANRLRALVEQIGDGRAAPLILHLMRHHRLSRDDLGQLSELLKRLESETEGKRTS